MDQAAPIARTGTKLEPLLGRMRPAESLVREEYMLSRCDHGGIYEVQPPRSWHDRSKGLEALQAFGDTFQLQVRKDLPPQVLKQLEQKGLSCGIHQYHNRAFNRTDYKKHINFKVGEPTFVSFQDAVALLIDKRWGELLEEVAQ